jgi:transposase
MKTFRYRLYPNKIQEEKLAQNLWCWRFIYNWGLWLSKEKYPWRVNLANTLKEKKKELKLSDRTYHCKNCWHIEDRDLMASKNILTMAQATKL